MPTNCRERFDGFPLAIFAAADPAVAGALIKDEKRQPGPGGQVVYLNTTGSLDACLARVQGAGGAVVLPKTDLGKPGFIAPVRDTEGNVVGVHSEP
jgi:predicted enzyme related to lactoylglutathione lyase